MDIFIYQDSNKKGIQELIHNINNKEYVRYSHSKVDQLPKSKPR